MIPFVFMDESGNKQEDRFFVCGFLEIQNPHLFISKLQRIRDQIFNTIQVQREERSRQYLLENDLQGLFSLARKQSSFELKFNKITLHTIKLYDDFIKALAIKTEFRFKAIVIDRRDPEYCHDGSLEGMYRHIMHMYFDHIQTTPCVFVPDQFDPQFDWATVINRPQKILGVLPATSHEFLLLQTVDLLTGIIRLGLEIQSGEKQKLGRNDTTRKQMIETFEQYFSIEIKPVADSTKKPIGIWTIDFSKSKKPRHEH